MKNLTKKDFAVLLVAMAMTMPALLVFNGNEETWYLNILGMVYVAWIVRKLSTTKIGRAFCARMGRIEDKIFGAA